MYVATVVLGCFLLGQQSAALAPKSTAPSSPPPAEPAVKFEEPAVKFADPAPVEPTDRPASQAGAADSSDPAAAPKTFVPAEDPAAVPKTFVPAENPVAVPKTFVPAEAARPALTPPQRLAEILSPPPDSKLQGRPTSLLEALSSTVDRRRQLEITHAYWRLVETVGLYGLAWNYNDRMQRLGQSAAEGIPLRTARATAAARLREAEVAAIAMQHELAALVLLPPDAALPLPADRPHVGPYRTYFEQKFPLGTAPAAARRIEQTLPIWCRAIDAHTAAIDAAEETLEAATSAQQAGRVDGSTLVACIRRATVQREALLTSVCRYNDDIADYALLVADPAADGQALVRMLIEPAIEQGGSMVAGGVQGAVQAAGLNEPVPTPGRRPDGLSPIPSQRLEDMTPIPATRAREGVPTLAPTSPDAIPLNRPSGKQEPTLAPPLDEPPSTATPSTATPSTATGPASTWNPSPSTKPANPSDSPAAATVPDSAGAVPAAVPLRPIVPVDAHVGESTPEKIDANLPGDTSLREEGSVGDAPASTTLKKPVAAAATLPLPDAPASESFAIYAALADVAPGSRAKQLAVALHWNRDLPADSGKPLSLPECLQSRVSGDRRALIEAYWRASQRAAEYQALAEQAQWLEELAATTAENNGLAVESRLRGARRTTEAALHEAHVALIDAQFDLAVRTGRESERLWPLPSTAPHSGSYLLRLEAQPPQLVQSWPMRRLAAVIPGLSAAVLQHAAAVVDADAARAAAMQRAAKGAATIEEVLAAVDAQTEQTQAFLQALTDYNGAIAEYVLTILPPAVPSDTLVAALVVEP